MNYRINIINDRIFLHMIRIYTEYRIHGWIAEEWDASEKYRFATVVIRYEIRKSYNFPRARRYLYSYGCCSFGATLLSIRFPERCFIPRWKKKKTFTPLFPFETFLLFPIIFIFSTRRKILSLYFPNRRIKYFSLKSIRK